MIEPMLEEMREKLKAISDGCAVQARFRNAYI
jgi:hypothetical protein